MADPRDVTGPLPRVPRDAAEIRRRGEEVLEDVAARSRANVRTRIGRLKVAAPLILQSAVAAALAWYLAQHLGNALSDHPQAPIFAPVAAVVSLGSALGQRLRRTVELVLGVALGVGVGDLLIKAIGSGTLQLALIVALAMTAAVLVDGGQLLVIQAATSSVLVATIVTPDGSLSGLDRFRDTLVGGGVGILVALILLPLNPLAVAQRAVAPVTTGLADALDAVAAALRAHDIDAGLAALTAARGLEPRVATMNTAVATSEEIARVAPMRWRSRDRFAVYAQAAPQLDYAARSGRVLARRGTVLLRGAEPCPPQLIEAVSALAGAVRLVGEELGGTVESQESRRALVNAYALARGVQQPDSAAILIVLIAQIRTMAYDLLRATGLNRVDALALLDG
ncbi:MAG TPA: FUSC family protein [Sporichthya sp.]|nr:FUSC family protein [Sporichthya sp.]